MIESVHIQGFQSLADVEIPLGRFTVIQGRSNSGKSAVIRAMRAAVTNAGNMRGTGGSFIRHGSKECSVAVRRPEGLLTWTKGGGKSGKTTYDLNGREFTTGTEVPEPVASFLQLGDIVIDEANSLRLNVNFQGGGRNQGQFEPPFLVVDRAGSYLAKVFALLTSANVLYEAQAVAKKEAGRHGSRLKTVRELATAEQARLAELQQEHSTLRAAALRVDALWAALTQFVNTRDALRRIDEGIRTSDMQIVEVEQQLATWSAVDLSAMAEAERLSGEAATLRQYQETLRANEGELHEVHEILSSTLPDDVSNQLADAEAAATQAAALRRYQSALAAADAELAAAEREVAEAEVAAEAARQEFAELVESLESCPTCGGVMHAEAMLV